MPNAYLDNCLAPSGMINNQIPRVGRDGPQRLGADPGVGRSALEAHTFEGIGHVCGNMRFLATGDDTAEGITVLSVYVRNQHEAPGTSVPWTVGEDRDQFVRTENHSRLFARRWVSLFERPAPEPPTGRLRPHASISLTTE